MAMLRKRRHDEIDPFSDLLFNTLLAFVMMNRAEYFSRPGLKALARD